MRRSLCMRLSAALLSLIIMLLTCANVVADESVQVSIPVIATGADCSMALLDANGQRVQLVALKADVESTLVINCNGLKQFTYKALLYDKNTETVTYDNRSYGITINVIYDADGNLSPVVSIDVLDAAEGKVGKLEFNNTVYIPETPTPEPTLTPTPTPTITPDPTPTIDPTATPQPYDKLFTFTKVWSGGKEPSIEWTMYNADGSQRHKLFSKYEVGEYEWRYEAYFQSDVSDCYVIETPVEGYQTIYQNVGEYSHVTDRCYSGGKIINYKLPETGDETPIANYTALVLVSLLGMTLLMMQYRRVTKKKS